MPEDAIDAEPFREMLLARLAELDDVERAGRENARPVELDQTSVGRLSRMDAMQVQAMAQETERRRANERRRIAAALERIAAGDFGYCVTCDEPIPRKRLELDPAIPTCIACSAAGGAAR